MGTDLGHPSREQNSFNDKENVEFNSKEEAFSYYREYAKSMGFSAIIKTSRRSRISGNFIDAKFACTRYENKPKPQSFSTPSSNDMGSSGREDRALAYRIAIAAFMFQQRTAPEARVRGFQRNSTKPFDCE
ncbi:FAR1 DNA-binding domain [Sesbania bispinosa]|nr:FAR1 DNA-binding domain [Sesbania bispinosa]